MGPMCVRNSEVQALHVQGSAVIDRRYSLSMRAAFVVLNTYVDRRYS